MAEDLALSHLQRQGMRLLSRNYRTPGRGGGEIDLIMTAPDGTLVFVEVRARATRQHGGAGGSIGTVKQQRIIYAAHQYLSTLRRIPPCRFDVVLVEPNSIEWLQAVFDAS